MWRFGKDGAYRQHDGLQTRFGSAVSLCTPRRAHGAEESAVPHMACGSTAIGSIGYQYQYGLFVGNGW